MNRRMFVRGLLLSVFYFPLVYKRREILGCDGPDALRQSATPNDAELWSEYVGDTDPAEVLAMDRETLVAHVQVRLALAGRSDLDAEAVADRMLAYAARCVAGEK